MTALLVVALSLWQPAEILPPPFVQGAGAAGTEMPMSPAGQIVDTCT